MILILRSASSRVSKDEGPALGLALRDGRCAAPQGEGRECACRQINGAVGWAKALLRRAHHLSTLSLAMVGTLRFAHPTGLPVS
ncbi:hypothetical protein AB7M17_002898 [Bradyrhizobium sp. USDA 377]